MTSASMLLEGLALELLPERAVFWPAQQTLLIADLHLGKAAAFRRAGLAIPEGDTSDTLERCTQLINRYVPERLILLGDILHTRLGADPELARHIQRWRAQHATLPILAIQGNHDRELDALNGVLDCQSEGIDFAGLRLFHHPPEHPMASAWVAGHWHPVAAIQGAGDRLRLPAFVLTHNKGLVLPAFGSLTGGFLVAQAAQQKRFITSGEGVFSIDP